MNGMSVDAIWQLLKLWLVLIPFWALMKVLFEGPINEPGQLWMGWHTLVAATFGWAVSFLWRTRAKS